MQPQLALRWYQQEAVEAVFNYLRHESGSPVIVLPTGAGKSIVLAEIAQRVVKQYQRRVLIVAHRKELLTQNAEKVRLLLPDVDVGIYSAGLNARDVDHDVICCGIQSIYDKAHLLGSRHLVLIDEVHLVPSSGEGMYRTFTQSLQALNPSIRFVGLTATPFRTSEGRLTGRDKLFNKICYTAPITRLISEGYLSHLVSTPAEATIDTSKLHVRGGEFVPSEVESLFNADKTVTAACQELAGLTSDRKSILVFCAGVNHAAHVARIIESMTGEEVGTVTGQTASLERAGILMRFKEQRLRWCVNVDVLTTGFDAPSIDCVAVLRATLSPGIFAQMVGRGLRTSPAKKDCLILDFGQNLQRHGPIDSPTFGMESQRSGDGTGEAVVKTCPACGIEQYARSLECECGFVFAVKNDARHDSTSEREAALLEAQQKPRELYVTKVDWSLHRKRQAGDEAPPTLRMNYHCESEDGGDLTHEVISEWVCLQHEGFARTKAAGWWKAHSLAPAPRTISEAISLLSRGAVAMPSHITVKKEGKFFRIVGRVLDEKPEAWQDESTETNNIGESGFGEDDVPF